VKIVGLQREAEGSKVGGQPCQVVQGGRDPSKYEYLGEEKVQGDFGY